MGDTDEGEAGAEAEAEVHIGTEAMKTVLPMEEVVIPEGMMKGIATMKAGQEDTEAIALLKGVDVADTGVPVGKEVKRGVPKLRNGTVRRNRKKMPARMVLLIPTEIMLSLMEISTEI